MLAQTIEAWDAALNTWFASLGAPVEDVSRLVLAAVFGGLVGLEREMRGRQAGFRTCLLVCVGSALVMLVSIQFARHQWMPRSNVNVTSDPARIAYGVMTGIGFLCAGVILKGDTGVRGLTTAAGIWCVAAIGLSIGFGMYLISAVGTLIVVSALWLLDYIGNLLPKTSHRKIVVRCPYSADRIEKIVTFVRKSGVKVIGTNFQRSDDLARADIDVRIAYNDVRAYKKLERSLADAKEFDLMSSQDF